MKRGSKVTIHPREAKWILDHLEVYDIPGKGFNETAVIGVSFFTALAMYGKPLVGEVVARSWTGDAGIVRFEAPGYKVFISGGIKRGKVTA